MAASGKKAVPSRTTARLVASQVFGAGALALVVGYVFPGRFPNHGEAGVLTGVIGAVAGTVVFFVAIGRVRGMDAGSLFGLVGGMEGARIGAIVPTVVVMVGGALSLVFLIRVVAGIQAMISPRPRVRRPAPTAGWLRDRDLDG